MCACSDDRQTFKTEIPPAQLCRTLKDHLLVPFINRVQHSKDTNIACSYISVNGTEVKTEEALNSPLNAWVTLGAVTRIVLTLELVEVIKDRRAGRGVRSYGTLGSEPTMRTYAVEKVGGTDDAENDALPNAPQLGTVEREAAASERARTSVEQAMGMRWPPAGSSGSPGAAGTSGATPSKKLFFLDADQRTVMD